MHKHPAEIDFNTYFISEFSERIVQESRKKLDAAGQKLISDFKNYLLAREKTFDVIEELASSQSTNDLAIFLFDMIENQDDVDPAVVDVSLSGWAENFITLFDLFKEDEQSQNELRRMISKQVSPTSNQENLLTAAEFIRAEKQKNLENALREAQENTQALVSLCLEQDIKPKVTAGFSFHSELEQWHNMESDQAGLRLAEIGERAKNLIGAVAEFVRTEPDLAGRMISGKTLAPKAVGKSKVHSVDDVLAEYFQAEVRDHQLALQKYLSRLTDDPFSPFPRQDIVKEFRLLKEVSMIHGYAGLEFSCTRLIRVLESAAEKNKGYGQDIFPVFQEIVGFIGNTSLFRDESRRGELLPLIDDFCRRLDSAFINKPARTPKTEIPKKPLPASPVQVATTEVTIPFEETEKIFAETWQRTGNWLLKRFEAGKFEDVLPVLNAFTASSIWYNTELSEYYFLPLAEYIQQSISEGIHEHLPVLRNIIGYDLAGFERLDAQALFPLPEQKLTENIIEEEFPEIRLDQLLFETAGQYWHSFVRAENGLSFAGNCEKLLYFVNKNAADFNLSYTPLFTETVNRLRNEFPAPETDASILNEAEQSIGLILERCQLNPTAAEFDDIIEALTELILQPAEEAAEDESGLFAEEARQHVAAALEAMRQIHLQPDDRSHFYTIEFEIHSLKTTALLIGNELYSSICDVIEEVAEFYSNGDDPYPAGLMETLQEALLALQGKLDNPAVDVDEYVHRLDQIQMQLMIDGEAEPVHAAVPGAAIEMEMATPEEIDDELIEIFKSESQSLLDEIDLILTGINSAEPNFSALNQFESAAHSLKTAAKILGHRQIGQIMDSVEAVVEWLKDNPTGFNDFLMSGLIEAMNIVKQLRDGKTATSSEIASIINMLELPKYAAPADRYEPAPYNPQLQAIFLKEAGDLLDKMSQTMLELEKNPGSSGLFSEFQRQLHTLKGSSLMAGFTVIGELCHKLEDYLEDLQARDLVPDSKRLDPVFEVTDLIAEMIRNTKEGDKKPVEGLLARMAQIDNKIFQAQNFQPGREVQTEPAAKISPVRAAEEDNSIRVDTHYVDSLIDQATDLLVNRTDLSADLSILKHLQNALESEKKRLRDSENILEEYLETGPDQNRFDTTPRENLERFYSNYREMIQRISSLTSDLSRYTNRFEHNVNRISNISQTLHNNILNVRMIPVERLFSRFQRPVRDLAKSLNKKVELIFEGSDTEMDRAMIEMLTDPLMHILRNALDHGIEKPEERLSARKPETGSIRVSARRERSQILFEIEDDGQGIDLEKIRETALRKGLIGESESTRLSEVEWLNFIFYPEFSTRQEAGLVSGRGIGMDVVANQIQKLKGNIRIHTEYGRGTKISIRVPLTLVISQAVMFKNREQIIAVPIIAVQETAHLEEGDLIKEADKIFVKIRGKLLPYIDIDEILRYTEGGSIEKTKENILVIHDAGVNIALGVGDILGHQEIVIKSLGSHLQNVEFIAGGTILGTGQVALILDYSAVVQHTELGYFGRKVGRSSLRQHIQPAPAKKTVQTQTPTQTEDKPEPVFKAISKKTIRDRQPTVLVVDDSASVQNFVSSFLEKNGYYVLKTDKGAQALEWLFQDHPVDLLITDIQMPEMSGFELIDNIRGNNAFNNLPIVILTGQSGQQDRTEGARRGANAFILKPFKEHDLLQVLSGFIDYKKL